MERLTFLFCLVFLHACISESYAVGHSTEAIQQQNHQAQQNQNNKKKHNYEPDQNHQGIGYQQNPANHKNQNYVQDQAYQGQQYQQNQPMYNQNAEPHRADGLNWQNQATGNREQYIQQQHSSEMSQVSQQHQNNTQQEHERQENIHRQYQAEQRMQEIAGAAASAGVRLTPAEIKAYKQDFDSYDANKDGVIDAEEIRLYFPEISQRELTAFWDDVDANLDGGLTLEEYVNHAMTHTP